MGIETATYISDLQAANPGSSDLRSQGDDHLRLLKAVLQATFPVASKAWYNPTTQAKSADFSVVAADMNKTFLVDTSGGVVNMTLPTLASGDAGWECFLIKTTAGVNPVMVKPATGTLMSGSIAGLAAARRSIPGIRVSCLWNGAGWNISRASTGGPVGSCLEYHGSTLPYGYEFPNGQTLSSASTLYPEFYAVNGSSGVTLDKRGRLGIPLDNLGGSAAGRLSGGIITGTAIGNVGGTDTITLSTSQIPAHTHSGTTGNENATHTHAYTASNLNNSTTGGGAFPDNQGGTTLSTGNQSANHQHNFTTDNGTGGGLAHSNLQPSIMVAQVLVVE